MTISDMSVVTAEVKVDETDITNLRNGQSADVTIDAIPGKMFKGHVTEVGELAILAHVRPGGDDRDDGEHAGSARLQSCRDAR